MAKKEAYDAEPLVVFGGIHKEADRNDPEGYMTIRWAGSNGFGGIEFYQDGDFIVLDSEMMSDKFVHHLMTELVNRAVRPWRDYDKFLTIRDTLEGVAASPNIKPQRRNGCEWRFRTIDGVYSDSLFVLGGQKALTEAKRVAIDLATRLSKKTPTIVVAECLLIAKGEYVWVNGRIAVDAQGAFDYVDKDGNPIRPVSK